MAIKPKGKKVTGTKRKDKIVWKKTKVWNKNLTVNAAAGNDIIDFSKSRKNNTLIGGKGKDIIKTGKGKDKIIINKGDGNDTIYHNAKQTTVWIKGAKAKDTQLFTRKGNDLILKYSHATTKTSETITFKNYFVLKNKNIYLKTTNTKLISDIINSKGLPVTVSGSNSNVKGSEYNDIITINGNNNTVDGGFGNDKIILNSATATVKMSKSSGNDTLTLNKESEDLRIVFDSDAAISYVKSGNNLVITGKHANNIAESLTLINYFKGANQSDLYAKTYLVQGNNKNTIFDILNDGINNAFITINGDANKNNKIAAAFAKYNTLIGGNNTDIMYGYNGNNEKENTLTTFITGAKGTSFIEGYDNDKYIVSSINSKTIINNFGNASDTYGNDTLQINGANIDDLYLYFNVDKNSGLYADNTLYVMNGAQLTSNLANNAFANPYTITWIDENAVKLADNIASVNVNTNGITLEKYMYYSDGYKYRMNNFSIADSNGNNAKTVTALTIDSVNYNSENEAFNGAYKDIANKVKSYLADKPYANTQALLDYINQNPNNADAKTMLNELTAIYKSVKLGTNGDDTYTNLKNNSVYSESGNDTFKIAKDFGEVAIYSDNVPNSTVNTNTIIFTDSSFDNDSLSVNIDNTEKTVFISDNGGNNLTYKGFFNDDDTSTIAKTLVIQDKNRSYNVKYNAEDENYSSNTDNNIICIQGETTLTLNDKYNRVFSNDNTAHTINFADGNDICVSKGNSADIYNIEYNSSVKITDKGGSDTYNINLKEYTSVVISDTNGTDAMNIKYKSGIGSARLFFNVNNNLPEPSVDGDLFIFFEENDLIIDNIQNTDNPTGIKIENYFNSENKVETIIFGTDFLTWIDNEKFNSWIDNVKQNVASWLSGTQYDSVSDVFEKGISEDIRDVLTYFDKSYDYQFNSNS